jgi:TonB family protein
MDGLILDFAPDMLRISRTGCFRMVARFLSAALLTCVIVGIARAEHDRPERKTILKVPPNYPETAKRLHLSGTVTIEIDIAEDGSVRVVKILGGNPLLADCAAKALAKWKYERARAETREVHITFTAPENSY